MESLAKKYPKYYKELPSGVKPDEIDTYVINRMFPVDDPTGTVLHARKKLLIPGVRSGGKSMLKDIIEARDTLNRYIALMDEQSDIPRADGQPDSWTLVQDGHLPIGVAHVDAVDVYTLGGQLSKGVRASCVAWEQNLGAATVTHYRLAKG